VELDPGESVEAELIANRGVMKVRIVFNAYLIGSTAVNYNPVYKEHHFWALDIGGVMGAGSIPNTKQYTEDMEIGFYSNSKVELKDPSTGQVKATFLAGAVPGAQSLVVMG
jgi:hypothetical protein